MNPEPDISVCPTCRQKFGRTWRVRPADRYCGLCGSKLRVAAIRQGGVDIDGPLPWFVGADAVTAKFKVHKTGILPIEELTLSTEGLFIAPKTLPGLKDAPEEISITVPAASTDKEFKIDGQGIISPPLHLIVRSAPKELSAKPIEGDVWAEKIRESQEIEKSDVKFMNDEWSLSTRLPLLADFDADPASASFRLTAAQLPEEFLQAALHPMAKATLKPKATPSKEVQCQVKRARNELEVTILLNDMAETLRNKTIADATASKLEGKLEIQLHAVGTPKLVFPLVDIFGGRPAWKLTRDVSRQWRIPGGIFSLVRTSFAPEPAESVNEFDLQKAELWVAPPPGWEVSYRPEKPDQAQDWALYVKPPSGESEADLSLRLWAPTRSDGKMRPLGPSQAVKCTAYKPKEDSGAYAAAVVDFGTTNTCVSLSRNARGDGCKPIDKISRKKKGEVIPTIIAVWNAGSDKSLPRYCIGDPALQMVFSGRLQGSNKNFAAFSEFKTFIMDPDHRNHPAYFGVSLAGFNDSPENLTYLYLRELILELRAQNDNEPLSRLQLTFPSTFSQRQRTELARLVQRVSQDVAGCLPAKEQTGLQGYLLLDEANAGAFQTLVSNQKDKYQYLLILDWGGGTFDVAVLMIASDADSGGDRVRPLGMTGIRKLGGQNVTREIARLLERQFNNAMNEAKSERREQADDGPNESGSVEPEKGGTDQELNAQAIRRFAEAVKIATYGIEHKPAFDDKWYEQLEKDLLKDKEQIKEIFKEANLNLRRRGGEVDAYEWIWPAGNADPKVKLSRDDVDNAIRSAVEEGVERALRLWQRVWNQIQRGQTSPSKIKAPDRIVLAGSSSRIHLLRKVLEDKLKTGFPDIFPGYRQKIDFKPTEAKTCVANGAVEYSLKSGLGYGLRLEECQNFVLLPLCLKRHDGYMTLFECGEQVKETPIIKEVSFPVYHGVYMLHLSRDIDLEANDTRNESLQKLGIDEDGKEQIFSSMLQIPKFNGDGPYSMNLTFSLVREGESPKKLLIAGLPPGNSIGPIAIE